MEWKLLVMVQVLGFRGLGIQVFRFRDLGLGIRIGV